MLFPDLIDAITRACTTESDADVQALILAANDVPDTVLMAACAYVMACHRHAMGIGPKYCARTGHHLRHRATGPSPMADPASTLQQLADARPAGLARLHALFALQGLDPGDLVAPRKRSGDATRAMLTGMHRANVRRAAARELLASAAELIR